MASRPAERGPSKRGYLVGIFPKGTRSKDGQIGPLKPGFIALIRRGDIPLIPVGLAALVLAPIPASWGARFRRILRTLVFPARSAGKLADYVLLWGAVHRQGAAADRVLYRQSSTLQAVRRLALQHGEAGLWIANDWLMLPLGAEGAGL